MVLAVMPPYEVYRFAGSIWILNAPTSGGFWIMDDKSSSSSTISGSFIGFLAMWEVENLSLVVALSTDVESSAQPWSPHPSLIV
jgi:hypothetical protein